MAPIIDVNMFVGQFPFRRVAGATVEECLTRMERVGITGALVSAFEAVFQEDSYPAEVELAKAIASRDELVHFKVVNPTCNWWRRDLERALGELRVAGMRLCCTFHDYCLTDPAVRPVLEFARTRGLPVLVMCRMQDFRLQWLMDTREADVEEARAFLDMAEGNRVILAGLHVPDMLRLADAVNARPDVLLDTSRLKGPWRTFRKLEAVLDLSRVAFGSLWPINLPECPLEQLRHARISDEAKRGILHDNAGAFLAGT